MSAQQRVQPRLGNAIDVSQRWPDYNRDRQAAKAAVSSLTADLQQALAELI
ncbi:hypothetical protein [Trichothermofontia sp.]